MESKKEFKDRLRDYRESLYISKKSDMAKRLDMPPSLYNFLESGKRQPSKAVLDKLMMDSNMPEEYWLYGVTQEKEYLNIREELKCIKSAVESLYLSDLLDPNGNWSDEINEMLLTALKADIIHLDLKRKKQREE